MSEFLLFQTGGTTFAISLGWVASVHRLADMAEICGSGKAGRSERTGHCRIAGRKVPWVDLGVVLGMGTASVFQRLICIRVFERLMAIRADYVERVLEIAADAVLPVPPPFSGKSTRWFPQVLDLADRLVLVLDPEGMLGGKRRPVASES